VRARSLKPAFFKNEQLARCEPLARILFAGLWCMADREGRLEYRLERIKIELLPFDDGADISVYIRQLTREKLIRVYNVGRHKYIAVPNFLKHQNPHKQEQPSVIPPPSTGRLPNKHGATSELAPGKTGSPPASSLTPSSLTPSSLTPSSLTPDSGLPLPRTASAGGRERELQGNGERREPIPPGLLTGAVRGVPHRTPQRDYEARRQMLKRQADEKETRILLNLGK
jgi:hypothetical protein